MIDTVSSYPPRTASARLSRLVIADRIDSLTVTVDDETGLLPPATVIGQTYGVLMWDLGDRMELLALASCPVECEDPTRDAELVRTTARVVEALAPHTV